VSSPDSAIVKQFLGKLDPSNDGHWTTQGLPRMDVLVSFGLTVERRELNELVPGFNRAAAAAQVAANPPPPQPALKADEEDYFTATNRHIAERAKRRRAALEHLVAGGFTMKDLEPVRSKLDLGIRQRNRMARRELGG
jgi:hypothetical protein